MKRIGLQEGLTFDIVEKDHIEGYDVVLIGLNRFKKTLAEETYPNEKNPLENFDNENDLEAYLSELIEKLGVDGCPIYDNKLEDYTYLDRLSNSVYTLQVMRLYSEEQDQEILIFVF